MNHKFNNRNQLIFGVGVNGQLEVICPLTRKVVFLYKCSNCIYNEVINRNTKIVICYTPSYQNGKEIEDKKISETVKDKRSRGNRKN
jgi:hypothetical protein